jgi:hypothetical protein
MTDPSVLDIPRRDSAVSERACHTLHAAIHAATRRQPAATMYQDGDWERPGP